MDSKIALLNVASDFYRVTEEKVFLNKEIPEKCKSCSKSYFFIDKKYNFCSKCFLNQICTVDFYDEKIIIKIKETNKVIFEENISILLSPKDDNLEISRNVSTITNKNNIPL